MDRDWQSFERKLAAGKLIEQAAAESGVPVEEALVWLVDRKGRDKDDEALRILSAEALHHGITTLIELTKIREGRVGTETDVTGDGKERTAKTTKFDHPDGSAARALVQAGLKLRQIIKPPVKSEAGVKDLFDDAPEEINWTFPPKR